MCLVVANRLSKLGVEYTKVDVSVDGNALQKLTEKGVRSLPVCDVNGELLTSWESIYAALMPGA